MTSFVPRAPSESESTARRFRHIEGDTGSATCPTCGWVDTVFQRRDVLLGDGSAILRGALVGVCTQCDTAVSLPAGGSDDIEVLHDCRSEEEKQSRRGPYNRLTGEREFAPPQMSHLSARHLRALQMEGIPRIGTSAARDLSHLVRKAEDIALVLNDMLQERQAAADPNWWHTQDLLDDAMDVLNAVERLARGKPLGEHQHQRDIEDAPVEGVCKQVLVVRKDINMSRGKQGSQASHGAVNALAKGPGAHKVRTAEGTELRIPLDPEAEAWLDNDYRKIVLAIHSETELLALHERAIAAGLRCYLVQDNGLTMFDGQKTYTALAIGPHLEAAIDPLTGHLKPL